MSEEREGMSRILGMRGTRLNEARPGTGKERGGEEGRGYIEWEGDED